MNDKKGTEITIVEVGPRDGFQNLKKLLPTTEKKRIIDGMVEAGIKTIEVTSFISPKAIPQMADAKEIAQHCREKYPDVKAYALAPNLRGAKDAWESGIRHIQYVISLSKSHNKANINRTHEESFADLADIMENYPDLNVCVGLATIFGCPFEGVPSIEDAVKMVNHLYHQIGIREFNLADTIGIADPAQIRSTVRALQDAAPDAKMQVHIHDTRGMGLVNTLAAIECGITTVQSALGGLGGCPFAPGASGNTATEDLVFMLHRMGYDTGIDFDKLLKLAKYQVSIIDGVYSGHQIKIDSEHQIKVGLSA